MPRSSRVTPPRALHTNSILSKGFLPGISNSFSAFYQALSETCRRPGKPPLLPSVPLPLGPVRARSGRAGFVREACGVSRFRSAEEGFFLRGVNIFGLGCLEPR